MNRPLTSAREVERLLREAGVADATPAKRPGNGGPPCGPVGRFVRRLRNRLLLLLLCIVLVLAATLRWSTGTATDPLTAPTGSQIGPNNGTPLKADPRFGIVEAFRDPRAAGTVNVGWERMIFSWKELQKGGADTWNAFATDHDREIDRDVQAGRQIAGLLINTPDWAAVDPAVHGASVPKGLYLPYDDPHNYWGHFVGLIAKRYAGRIDDWIIWNEVNIPSGQWHTWAGSNADYAQLVKVAYLAAKAANPHARIVLAGDPYWYDHGALFVDLVHRLTGDPAARAHDDYFDVVNLHLYSSPTEVQAIVPWYRSTMARLGISKPIWIAETNVIPYDDTVRTYPRGGFRASLDDQASFIVQAFAIDLVMGVERVEINRMIDGTDFAAGGEPFGLVRNDGTARPALFAYRTAAALFAGVTGGVLHFDRQSGIYTVVLRKPGERITVTWDQHPTSTSVRIAAHGAQAEVYDKFGQYGTVRPVHGYYSLKLNGATGNTNSADPRDYVIGGSPLIVVERS